MNLKQWLFLFFGITGATLAFPKKTLADLKNIKVEEKTEVVEPSIAFRISAESAGTINSFFYFDKSRLTIPFLVTTSLDKYCRSFDALVGISNKELSGAFKLGVANEKWTYENANRSNFNRIIENRVTNQSGEKNKQALGVGFGNIERVLVQVLYQPGSTNDKTNETVKHEETNPYYKITTHANTTADIKIEESLKSARLNLVFADQEWYRFALDLIGSWLNVEEKGSVKTDVKTQVIVNEDTTQHESQRTTQIDRKITNEFYKIAPTAELNKENIYGYTEVPVGFGDYSRVGLNGILSKQWNECIGGLKTEIDFTNKKAGIEINLYKSKNVNSAFGALKKHYRAYYNNRLDILFTDEQRANFADLTYHYFARSLQGVGVGVKINTQEGKLGYEINAIGSRKGYLGLLSVATSNPENIKDNYTVSLEAGCSSFSIGGGYGKSGGEKFWKLNLTDYR